MAMHFLDELIDALRSGKLRLGTVLDVLDARGTVPDSKHREEMQHLDRRVAEGSLEPAMAAELAGRLGALQKGAAADPAGDDATRVAPVGPPASVEDVTRIQPTRKTVPPSTDDATRIQPSSRRPTVDAPVDATGSRTTGTTGTTGSTSGGIGKESWERIAAAEGSEHVTVGGMLKGRFHLEKEIGRGGMGVVFLALDERKIEARDRDPYVAVKILNDEFRRHPDSLIALQREARRSQKLAHDNIVRVYDFDKDGTIVFMTMEYVDGSDLKQLIRERAYNGMPLAQARPLIEGMAHALSRAHAAGVVHSDFKPGNVMVTREGVPKVFDFGIARAGKHLGDHTGEETVFDAGTLGALTPAYASLEMIQGAEPTPSDDIYALGCVVFELLTGKHPFDKVSAEVAMREGRKPPPVPGLTRRQAQALRDAVAFTHEKRLKSAQQLVEGLRDVGTRERVGPYLLYAAIAVVLVAAGGWGLAHYLHARRVQQVLARFAIADPRRYADEDQAAKALSSLGDEDRKRLVLDRGELIEAFLLSRLSSYWDPARQRHDYAGAQHVFGVRDSLKLYSPRLDLQRGVIEKQKNDLLNQLDTRLSQRIDAGAIFADQPDNAVAILQIIRSIDPRSSLLKNAELELKYDAAIGQTLAAGKTERARSQLMQARALFPDSARLEQRQAQWAALAPRTPVAQGASAPRSVPEAQRALAQLLSRPSLSVDWDAGVADAMTALQDDRSPQTRQQTETLARTIVNLVSGQADPLQLPQASRLVDLGLKYAPGDSALLAQRARIDGLQQQIQARLDAESAAAEIATRIESSRRAAAANDVAKVQESLARIRALQPAHPFLAGEGAQLLADAYLGQANDLAQRGRFTAASEALARGLKVAGLRPDLRNAKARYDLVAGVQKARAQPPGAGTLAQLRGQLDTARKADAEGLAQLEASMKLHGQLPQGSLDALLEGVQPATATVTPTAPTTVAPASTAPKPSSPPVSGTPAPAAGHRPGSPIATGARPAATATATAPAAAAAGAPAAGTGSDPCGAPDLPGKARTCADTIDGHRGPGLLVIPGASGGRPFAMSRTEVTVAEFNRYCAASHQCVAKPAEDRFAAAMPITGVSLAQATAYTAWLSQHSGGYTYRLPTDAEWSHAAAAGGGWRQAPDSNCVPPSATGGDNGGAPIAALGRSANPWGLVNMTGNVWEWVSGAGGTAVRGGSYGSYWSDCNVDARRADSGTAQADVGIRLLREVR